MRSSCLTAILCFYAFIKETKIGEPFLYKHLNENLNISGRELTNEIYPIYPYSYLVILVPVFLFTDLLLYKPSMILEMVAQVVYRAIVVLDPNVYMQKIGMFAYGVASASEVAFYSYIYAKLEKVHYKKVTSWTRAAFMAGRCGSYMLGQTLVLTHLGDIFLLQYIGCGLACFVLALAIFMPPVHWKTVLERIREANNCGHSSVRPTNHQRSEFTEPETYGDYVRFRLRNMCSGLLHVYSIRSVRKWSVWWAMTTAMSIQVAQYAQVLWGEADRHDGQSLNGFAEAAYTAISTAAILLMNAVSINWDKWGEAALMLISALHSSILVLYSQTQSIYVMYACYVAYRSLYQVMITIAQWNLARKMIEESYGLVFGLNTFIALAMQTALTLTVSDKRGLGMNVRNQYLVYAGCHVVIGVIFTTSMCYTILTKQRRKAEIHVLSDNIHCKL
uniref:Battenin n=2 Tax=Parascaris univalens TaxID=6257 RepID=A0A915BEA1_PARUN